MAGRKPARTIRVTIVGPTAAHRPAKEEMATEMKPVTSMQQGSSRTPSVRRGFVNSDTRWRSHFVSDMTPAKPIDEQMAMMSEAEVIDLSNCLKAAIGSTARSAMMRPDVRRTRRVS